MQPYQKVAPYFKTYAYPSYHQKQPIFQLLRPNSYCLASQRWIYLSFYPLSPNRKFFLGVVLAYKRGTDRNTKTTITTTTNTKTKNYKIEASFSTTFQPNLPRNLLVGLVRRKGIRIVKTRKPPYKMPKPSRPKKNNNLLQKQVTIRLYLLLLSLLLLLLAYLGQEKKEYILSLLLKMKPKKTL